MAELTLTFLEHCYQCCVLGYEEPTRLLMSKARREELRELYRGAHWVERLPKDWLIAGGSLGFNNADVGGLDKWPEDKIKFVNEYNPNHPGLTQEFEIVDDLLS